MAWYDEIFDRSTVEYLTSSLQPDSNENRQSIMSLCALLGTVRAAVYMQRPAIAFDIELVAATLCWWRWKPEQSATYRSRAREMRTQLLALSDPYEADTFGDAYQIFETIPPDLRPRFLTEPTDAVLAFLSSADLSEDQRELWPGLQGIPFPL